MSEFAGTIATKEGFHLNQTTFLAPLTWNITDGARRDATTSKQLFTVTKGSRTQQQIWNTQASTRQCNDGDFKHWGALQTRQ